LSHIPQRKEKDCLNCGTIVQGKYCQECGQENVVPHETFWHMVKHFLYDITHFDSKFFDSMKFLLFKPGFLPAEYVRGRRASYLNPVKKYVFTSAVFFLLFFGFFVKTDNISTGLDEPLTKAERAANIRKGEKEMKKNPNNAEWKQLLLLLKDSTRTVTGEDLVRYWNDFDFINVSSRSYRNREEYDSIQNILPENEKDNWLISLVEKRNLALKKKYGGDPRTGTEKLIDAILHKLPYMLFVSLPLFALILKLLYVRRKEYYYADHGIFSIYHYIFSFQLLALVFGIGEIQELTGLEDLDWLSGAMFLSGGFYLYLSMKRFYKQGHGKTLIKFILLNIAALLIMILLFIIFILLAVFEI
jgi:Protein of unknown function (DUF3667)